jgi:hypothetical protein
LWPANLTFNYPLWKIYPSDLPDPPALVLGGGSGGFSEGLAVSWGHVFTRPGIWLARVLFGMTGPMTMASAGDNGDVGEEFAFDFTSSHNG